MYTDNKDITTFIIKEEATMSPATNIKEKKINDMTYLEFDMKLQSWERFNRNNRKYVTSYMQPSFNQPHIREFIRKKAWMCEAGHPMSNDPKRILTIDPKLISHKILNYWFKGNDVYGRIQTLLSRYGKELTLHVLQGLEPAVSLRAICPMKPIKPQSNQKMQKGLAFIVCYDWVFYPSHDDAYRDETRPIKALECDINSRGNVVTEGCSIIDSLSYESNLSLMDYIKDESKNLNFISSKMEIEMENCRITDDLKWAILLEGTDKVYVSLEDKIKQSVSSYLKSL